MDTKNELENENRDKKSLKTSLKTNLGTMRLFPSSDSEIAEERVPQAA